jgi:hypothetical protein
MALSLFRVQNQDLPDYWPGFMELFLEHGGRLRELSDPKHLFVAVLKGDWDLWVLADDQKVAGAMLCTWVQHSYDRIYQIQWLAGLNTLKYAEETLAFVEKYALAHGAGEVILFGREGWKKVLAPFGYSETQRVFTKPIRQLRGH